MKSYYSLFLLLLLFQLNALCAQKAIHADVQGQGQTVLFLPGFTNPGSIWEEYYASMEGDWQAHFITYAGFAGKPAIEFPWYPKIKTALANYIESQDLKHVVLIGHSMGGNLAIDLAHNLPNRIEKIVLVDTLPCMRALMFPGVSGDQMVYKSPFNDRTLAMSASDFKAMASVMASQMSNSSERHGDLAKWIEQADRKTYVYGYTDLLQLDQRPILATIQSKVLLLGAVEPFGAQAKINMEKQYALLPQKELVMIEQSRHFILFDQQQKMTQLINAFLNE
jgi:pimeloyl-ACP methyl ester carboxylesterase